jgi:hypothetical protein
MAMWLKALAVLVVAGIAAVSGFALASGDRSSGSATGSSSPAPLAVSPASGDPRTVFSFTFKAPAATGRQGQIRLGYTLSVAGPSRPGCLSARSATAAQATQGGQVTVALDPSKLGGTWCPGTYTARVTEIQTPVCSPGEMCPQYIRVVATVATTRFSVVGP